MPSDKASAFDADKLVAALDRLAATPNENRVTLRERIAEPRVFESIKKAQMQKRTLAEIAQAMNEAGIDIKPGTLGLYLREIENKKGVIDAKSNAKPKEDKPRTVAAPSETKANTPAKSEGKPLTQKPKMGGAFDSNNL